MESKYNLLTRLLKNIKNVVNPDGGVAGVVPVVHMVTEETVALTGTLPDVAGYQWIPRQTGETPMGPFIQIDFDDAPDIIPAGVFIKPTDYNNWVRISHVSAGSGYIRINVSGFGIDGAYPSEDYFNGALIKVVSETSIRLDKTYKELVESGFFVVHAPNDLLPNDVNLLIPGRFHSDDRGFGVGLLDLEGQRSLIFMASTENDYPVLDQENSGSGGEDAEALPRQ